MIYTAALSLAGIGGILGLILAYASHKLHVKADPRVAEITDVLPGANCGSCGYPGCAGYAEAIVNNSAPLNACVPGKAETARRIAGIMGESPDSVQIERTITRVICKGGRDNAKDLFRYRGIADCRAAAAQFGGPKDCSQACIGLGSCAKACPFGAIKMGRQQLPEIDGDICTGCGLCLEICPKRVLELIKASHLVVVSCRNKDKAPSARESCRVACIKCKVCEKACPREAIKIRADSTGSIAVIDYELCDNCGLCAQRCPAKIISVLEPVSEQARPVNIPATGSHCGQCGLCGGREAG